MKRTAGIAIVLGIVAGASAVGAAQNNELRGSDTLEVMTEEILNHCKAYYPGNATLAALQYLGGGSSLGENSMVSNAQDIAPMSRALKGSTVCRSGQQLTAEGRVVGLDGIAIYEDAFQPADPGAPAQSGVDYAMCGVQGTADMPARMPSGTGYVDDLPWEGTDENGDGMDGDWIESGTTFNVGDANDDGVAAMATYTLNSWRDALRIIYAGMDQGDGNAIANQDCNSDVRHALVRSWSALFGGECGSGTGTHCNHLRHAYRRGDLSGTTDTVLSLLDLPSMNTTNTRATRPFCNGTDTEDLDPIRVPCEADEYVCALTNHAPRMYCTPRPAGQPNECTMENGTNGTCVADDPNEPTRGRCRETCTSNSQCGTNGTCNTTRGICEPLACSDQTATGVDAPPGTARGVDKRNRRTGCYGKGLVQPITVPEFANPEPLQVIYASEGCVQGSFSLKRAMVIMRTGGGRHYECPDCSDAYWNGTAWVNGTCSYGGYCLTPVTGELTTPPRHPACINRWNSRNPIFGSSNDGRVFNNWLRRADTSELVLDREGRFYAQVMQEEDDCEVGEAGCTAITKTMGSLSSVLPPRPANHRMSAGPQLYSRVDPVNPSGAEPMSAQGVPLGDPICDHAFALHNPGTEALVSATELIPCIVGATECSIGYSGRVSWNQLLSSTGDVLALRSGSGHAGPSDEAIEALITGGTAYPLARKLYLNTLDGFEALNGAQYTADQEVMLSRLDTVATCYGNKAVVDAAAIAAGFLAAPSPYANGAMACESFNETACNGNNICTSNSHCASWGAGATCNTTTGKCVLPCDGDEDCSATGRVCIDGNCEYASAGNSCEPIGLNHDDVPAPGN